MNTIIAAHYFAFRQHHVRVHLLGPFAPAGYADALEVRMFKRVDFNGKCKGEGIK